MISLLRALFTRFSSEPHRYALAILLSEQPNKANEKFHIDGLLTLQAMYTLSSNTLGLK